MGKFKGRNLAIGKTAANSLFESVSKSTCFFISHRAINMVDAQKISDYINESGFNTYLDKNDRDLQNAVAAYDSKKITECIQAGITNSSHIICVVSKDTAGSWWVPFEIGFATGDNLEVITLKLKGDFELPSYLKISTILKGIKSLNNYLESFLNQNPLYEVYSANSNDRYLIKESSVHPLKDTLDLEK